MSAKDFNLIYFDTPDFLLQVDCQFWPSATPESNELVWVTVATHNTFHCLRSGQDYWVVKNLNLWGN